MEKEEKYYNKIQSASGDIGQSAKILDTLKNGFISTIEILMKKIEKKQMYLQLILLTI